jgi:ketosteroid isomerase-like protein
MDGYARSAATVFVSGDNVTHGWQTVLDHYKKSYDSREKMGVLTFSDLEITSLGQDSAVVLGRWHLQRAKDEPHGRFTLIFRKTKQGWKIIHDHTSSALGGNTVAKGFLGLSLRRECLEVGKVGLPPLLRQPSHRSLTKVAAEVSHPSQPRDIQTGI